MYYIFWISKYTTGGPADRLDTIQDHQMFLVALIVSVSPRGRTETLGLRSTHAGTVRFYPTDEIRNGVLANEYPIVSGKRALI